MNENPVIYAHRPCTFYAQNVHIIYYEILDRIIYAASAFTTTL